MMSSAAPVVPELLRVGCAGWSLSRSDQEAFGAGDSVLQRYATRLPMVEVNSSFSDRTSPGLTRGGRRAFRRASGSR